MERVLNWSIIATNNMRICKHGSKKDNFFYHISLSQIFKLLNLLMFPMMLVLLGDRMLTGLSMILDIRKVLRLVLRERMNPISLGHSIPRPRLWLSFWKYTTTYAHPELFTRKWGTFGNVAYYYSSCGWGRVCSSFTNGPMVFQFWSSHLHYQPK